MWLFFQDARLVRVGGYNKSLTEDTEFTALRRTTEEAIPLFNMKKAVDLYTENVGNLEGFLDHVQALIIHDDDNNNDMPALANIELERVTTTILMILF